MVLLRSGSDSSVNSSDSPTVKRRWHKESTVAYHEAWRRIYAKRQPMAYLDPRFRVSKTNPSAPTLHFGLTFEKENIMHCAETHQLLPALFQDEEADPKQESRRFSIAVTVVKKYLQREYGMMLHVQTPLCEDGSAMFALYSNYTKRRHRQPKRERLILNSLREEMNMDPEHTAKWYWDMDHGLGYKSEHAEFNL